MSLKLQHAGKKEERGRERDREEEREDEERSRRMIMEVKEERRGVGFSSSIQCFFHGL